MARLSAPLPCAACQVADFGTSTKAAQRGGVGTPFWMAPELLPINEQGEYVEGKEVPLSDVKADIYSLGLTMWEMCVGMVSAPRPPDKPLGCCARPCRCCAYRAVSIAVWSRRRGLQAASHLAIRPLPMV